MKKLITILSILFYTSTFGQFTKVTAPIGRNNNADTTYPTHIDSLGKGGLIAFSSTANRDALPFALRKKGMIAIVADSMIYQLVGGIGNPNWVRRFFINGSSSGGGLLDSLDINGNILCEYFSSGVVKCFTLPGGNCVSHVENGSVIWDSLLVFHSTVFNYFIGCRNFTAPATDFTLDPAYVTAPRIDVWVVDTFGIIRVVKGDSSGLKYQYDPTWELEVAFATIGANSTVPSNITNVGVYLENIEWVGTSDIPGALFNYATNPYAGLLSTYVPSFTNGQFVQYTDNITYDISGISFLNYRLRLDAALSSGNINITFYNGLIAITNPVTILDGQYGFNSATVGSYQLNAIPSSAWTLNGNGTDFDAVKFTFSGTGGPLQLDNVILQIGGSGTGGGNVVTSFTGGDGSPPRIGNVILRRTDVVWNYDSTALNYDSTYYKHYSNGGFLDSTWIVKTPIVARNGITITDTTINGIAAKIFIGSGSGESTTASNGLRLVGSDVRLGDPLTANTTITSSGFNLIVDGTSQAPVFRANATNGIALGGIATTGTGVVAQATTGTPLSLIMTPATTNTIDKIAEISKRTSGTAANGIGEYLEYSIQTSTGSVNSSNRLISKWTTADNATRVSEFSITGVNNAVISDLFALSGNGALRLHKYGIGTFTGTRVSNLGVDASGNVIEVDTTGGGGVGSDLANFYLKDSSLSSDRTVDLNLNFLKFTNAGNDWLVIDPNNGDVSMFGFNGTNSGKVGAGAGVADANFEVNADFNSGTNRASIVGFADASTSTITHTGDISIFNGNIVYNTPPSGASTDSVLTRDASTGIVNMRSASGFVSSFTRQIITSGSTATVTGGNYIVTIDPASTLAAMDLTLPASPVDLDVVEVDFGGTLTSGTIVTALIISPNSGQTILDNTSPTTATADNTLLYRYRADNSTWYRFKP